MFAINSNKVPPPDLDHFTRRSAGEMVLNRDSMTVVEKAIELTIAKPRGQG